MVNRLRIIAALASGILALTAVLGAAQATPLVRVEPDRQRLTLDDRLRVRITVEGEPVVSVGSPESEDFAVIGHSTASRFQMVPGQAVVQATDIELVLRPRRPGRLLVGPIPIRTASGVTHTDPFSVLVEESPRSPGPTAPVARAPQNRSSPPPGKPAGIPDVPPAGSGALVPGPMPDAPRGQPFLVGFVSNARPVVGEPFIVDFVLHAPSLQLGMEIVDVDDPVFEGFWFRDITRERLPGQGTRLGSTRHQGELHDLHLLRSYSVVPLRDDLDRVPPFGALARIRGFARDQGELHMRSLPVPLEVSPPPFAGAGEPTTTSNVGRLELSARLSTSETAAGQPVRLTLEASGIGLMSRMLLPDPPEVAGIAWGDAHDRIRPDNGLWPGGAAVREWTLRGTTPGTVEIPPMTLRYWDPWQGAWRTATTAPLDLLVQPSETATDPEDIALDGRWQDALPPRSERPSAGPAPHHQPWYVPALTLPLVLLGFVAASPRLQRWRAKRRQEAAPGPVDVLRNVSPAATPEATLRAVADALRHTVSAHLGVDAKGRTRDALRKLAGGDLRTVAMIDLLDETERARFGAPDERLVAACRERALELLSDRDGGAS